MASEKIITGGEANSIAGSSIFQDEEKCLTYDTLTTNGFVVNATYSGNQLVKASDVVAGSRPQLAFYVYLHKYNIRQENQQYPIEYIIEVKPDNIDSFPEYNINNRRQALKLNAGAGASSSTSTFNLTFPMNSQTQTISIFVYKNANDVFSANLTYNFQGTSQSSSTSTRFVNQAKIDISANEIRNNSNITLNLDIQVLDTPRRTGTQSSSSIPKQASTFKDEIREILNKD